MSLHPTFDAILSTFKSIQKSVSYPVLGDLGPEYRLAIRTHLPPQVTLAMRLDAAREIVETRLKMERLRGERKSWTYDSNRQIALRLLLNAIDMKIAEFS